MAHFSKIENGIVVDVIVLGNDDAPDPFPESEPLGQQFIASLGLDGVWKQTSYNSNFRKNYGSVGFIWDEERQAFIPPKPFESWSLDEETCLWSPPIPYPDDGQGYYWDEPTVSWVAYPSE